MSDRNTSNHLTVCKRMSSGLFKKVYLRTSCFKSDILKICMNRISHEITYKAYMP